MKAVSAGRETDLVGAPEARAASAERGATLRQLLRLRWGLAAAGVLLLIVAGAVLAPWVSPHDPLAVDIRHRLAPPAWMDGGAVQHVLGTDQVGRDLLSRMIYGARVSLAAGVVTVLVASAFGAAVGLVAGY